MRLPFGISVPALILIGTFSAACDARIESGDSVVGPSPLQTAASAELRSQPENVRPIFGRDDSCRVSPPFQTTITVVVTAGQDLTITGVGFEFTDTLGGRTTPTVTPSSSTAASIPTTLPITLPTSQSIPIPQPGELTGLAVGAGTKVTLPFTLQFHCDVPGSGTVVIVIAVVDRSGQTRFSRTNVRVG